MGNILSTKFNSTKKEYLRDAIKKYQDGEISTTAFQSKLISSGVKIEGSNIPNLIRKVECGQREGMFRDFGKEVFK